MKSVRFGQEQPIHAVHPPGAGDIQACTDARARGVEKPEARGTRGKLS
jgi:hypothetical protein